MLLKLVKCNNHVTICSNKDFLLKAVLFLTAKMHRWKGRVNNSHSSRNIQIPVCIGYTICTAYILARYTCNQGRNSRFLDYTLKMYQLYEHVHRNMLTIYSCNMFVTRNFRRYTWIRRKSLWTLP